MPNKASETIIMTPSDFQELVDMVQMYSLASQIMLVVIVVLLIALGFVLSYWFRYLSKKADNAATKEDIELITDKVEGVKAQHNATIEALRAHYDTRAVVLLKQLDVHQQAFKHWHAVIHSVFKEDEGPKVRRAAFEWWLENCVYLAGDARSAFDAMLGAAATHKQYVDSRLPRQQVEENWATIRDAMDAILTGAALPVLPEAFKKKVDGLAEPPEERRKSAPNPGP